MPTDVNLTFDDGFEAGIKHGVRMTDVECLRFYNGVVAALNLHDIRFTTSEEKARLGLWYVLDLLHQKGMTATIGYQGTPVIKDRYAQEVAL
jgi:peptidoglycan/xylan/chitin deacetylase (PgdA/CDA1 family)